VEPDDASTPDDEVLAAAAARANESAFEALVVRYRARVYRLCFRLTGDEGDAAEATQETFVQLYRRISSFRGESRFSTWLYRVATNAALMQRRARGRRAVESLDRFSPEFDGEGRHVASVEALSVPCHIEQTLDRQMLAEKARLAVERLPELYRDAFVLRDLQELETAEVAEILGIERAAVRQRVHRARLLLRGYLSSLSRVSA
jgi:RNA polymerase sigma-70 factor (ECF subfamily)